MDTFYLAITLLVICLLFYAFFAGIETAFIVANRLNIELKKKQGKQSGIILSQLVEKPGRLFGTTLIGTIFFLVMFAILFDSLLIGFYARLEFSNVYVTVGADIIVASLVIIFLGEYIPKAIFKARAEAFIYFFSPAIRFFSGLFYPIAAILAQVSEWILRYVFNVRIYDRNETLGRNDQELFFQQNQQNDEENQEMNAELFENALSLPNVKIRQCLVPRTEIIGVDTKLTIEAVKQKMIETKLSKLVVYDENIDNIKGYLHQLDLFKNPADIQAILLPIPAVPESMSATDLINKFSKERKSIAWVVDEFGGTAGIVTMEDVLEEIFGEIKDEYDEEEFVEKQIAEDEYIFSGRLEIDYLNEKYNFNFSVEESETLSGFIIATFQAIPPQKERIIIDNYEFEVLNVSDTRIEMVKVRILK